MKVFSGRYSWDGKKRNNRDPVAWFPGSYDLKIFNVAERHSGIHHLKPYLCVYAKTGEGMSISENPEKFVQHVCDDFSLEIDKVLWAEEIRCGTPEEFEVVVITQSGKMGDTVFYNIEKRKPHAGERRLIEKELQQLE